MNPLQKVIKYFAMAFAVALTIAIFSSIFGIITGVTTGLSFREKNMDVVSYEKEFHDVKSLEVECDSYSVTIQAGDRFSVKTENVSEDYKANLRNNGTLVVESENKFHWGYQLFSFVTMDESRGRVIITVPESFLANKIEIDGGSGVLNLNNLHAKEMRLDLGSGRMYASNLVSDDVYIDGGSGDIQLENVDLSGVVIEGGSGSLTITEARIFDLDLDAASGATNIHGYFTGKCKIDGGSGNITLAIQDSIDNYNINAETGSGDVWVAGEKVYDNFRRNNITANHSIKIDGGSGRVALEFQ